MMRPLQEQTILITGATDGLGRALATQLAEEGATVLLHGRDDRRGERTVDGIRRQTGNSSLRWYRADLASLDEVRQLARQVEDDNERLDALVNNAGIGSTLPGGGRRMVSRDGYELRFAVNYLSHYLLTGMLLPLLERSAPARVVSVSSAGQTPIDFDDVMLEHGYSPMRAYSQSKLAQVMHTLDVAEEQGRDGRVTANCLHPATFMPTKMVFDAGASPASTLEQGVRATMRLLAAPELDGVSGHYYNGLRESRADPQAYDRRARRRLRELSDRLVGQTVATR